MNNWPILIGSAKGINMVVGGSLGSAGDNKWLMWNSGLFVWLSVLFAFLFCFTAHLGMVGIFFGIVIDEYIRGIWVLQRLLRNRWMGKSYVQIAKQLPASPAG